MNLIEKLKAGKRNIRTLAYPGTEEEIGITVLSEAETRDAIFATEREFKKGEIEVSTMTLGAYTSENNTQVLFRALVDPKRQKKDGTYERLFKDMDEFRDLLRREEKEILIEEYNAFEKECSPSPRDLSEEELEALADDLKKNLTLGTDSSFRTLQQLTIYLAKQLSTLQRANGSMSSL
jgi:hypothetical protein